MRSAVQFLLVIASGFFMVSGVANVVQAAGGGGTCTTEIHEKLVGGLWVFEKIVCLGTCPGTATCTECELGTYVDGLGHIHQQITCGCVTEQEEGEDIVQIDYASHAFVCDGVKDIDQTAGTETASCMGRCTAPDDCEAGVKQPYTEGGVQKRRFSCFCQ